jgi:hypothetical protein
MCPGRRRGQGQNAAQLLSLRSLHSESSDQVSPVTMSHPSPRTVAPPPGLPLYIKDSLKADKVAAVAAAAADGVCLQV